MKKSLWILSRAGRSVAILAVALGLAFIADTATAQATITVICDSTVVVVDEDVACEASARIPPDPSDPDYGIAGLAIIGDGQQAETFAGGHGLLLAIVGDQYVFAEPGPEAITGCLELEEGSGLCNGGEAFATVMVDAATPEPSSFVLMLTGVVLLGFLLVKRGLLA